MMLTIIVIRSNDDNAGNDSSSTPVMNTQPVALGGVQRPHRGLARPSLHINYMYMMYIICVYVYICIYIYIYRERYIYIYTYVAWEAACAASSFRPPMGGG